MKRFYFAPMWALGSLAAIVVIHHWLGEWLEYRLTLRYLLLMLCTGGLAWLNLRKHPRTVQFLIFGGFALLLGGLIACWKLGEVEAVCKSLGLTTYWEQRLYEYSLFLLALFVVLVSSVLPIFMKASEAEQSTKFSRCFILGAILVLDFAAAMPNTRIERIVYDIFYKKQAGRVDLSIADKKVENPITLKVRNQQEQTDTTFQINRGVWIETDFRQYGYFGIEGPRALLGQHTVFWQRLKDGQEKEEKNLPDKNNHD